MARYDEEVRGRHCERAWSQGERGRQPWPLPRRVLADGDCRSKIDPAGMGGAENLLLKGAFDGEQENEDAQASYQSIFFRHPPSSDDLSLGR